MAQHTPPTEGSLANADDLREEERLEDALEHLKVLHLQLRALRQTIPKLIEPLAKPQQSSSPEALFNSYRQAIGTANKNLADFRTEMTSETTQKILDDARASRQARPLGIRPWRATEHPDWTTPRKKQRTS
ncbi:hypothetical protein DL546_002138 [Coniochaeta pulveracea]|uniref:Mediator of RNA polymerase II transcription subunit 11 n=1 Tax=Coniochaeta pulveracea TaxID=177199 RepID=A0A420Y8I3_9PEZI|nr:hypothetical protein DL546_002138 [Coniochaeta pulveracea]